MFIPAILTCNHGQNHLYDHIYYVTADDSVPGRDHGHLHNGHYAKDPQANAADRRHNSGCEYRRCNWTE